MNQTPALTRWLPHVAALLIACVAGAAVADTRALEDDALNIRVSRSEPGDPDNPMKRVKMSFKEPDFFIHGTAEKDQFGKPASHGCIRMDRDDAEAVAKYVMEHGGNPRPESWFRRIFRSRQSKVVYLESPVSMTVS